MSKRQNRNLAASFDNVAGTETDPNINTNDNGIGNDNANANNDNNVNVNNNDNVKGNNNDNDDSSINANNKVNPNDDVNDIINKYLSVTEEKVLVGIYFDKSVAKVLRKISKGKRGVQSSIVNDHLKKLFQEYGWL